MNYLAKVAVDLAINVAINYVTTGEMNIGGALKETAVGLLNPIPGKNFGKLVVALKKVDKVTPDPGAAKGLVSKWKPGDSPHAPTRSGNTPSDRTVTRREWKNEANSPTRGDYTSADMKRMDKGNPPQRYNPDKGGVESMERSHEPIPRRDGGTETVPRWPQEHARVDPHRRPGY